jgi:hypothetical protein
MEVDWFGIQTSGKSPIPKSFTEPVLLNKIGYYPNRQKFDK